MDEGLSAHVGAPSLRPVSLSCRDHVYKPATSSRRGTDTRCRSPRPPPRAVLTLDLTQALCGGLANRPFPQMTVSKIPCLLQRVLKDKGSGL